MHILDKGMLVLRFGARLMKYIGHRLGGIEFSEFRLRHAMLSAEILF